LLRDSMKRRRFALALAGAAALAPVRHVTFRLTALFALEVEAAASGSGILTVNGAQGTEGSLP
jgi:hypothetical protein